MVIIKTVNVIELSDGLVTSCASFSDSVEGNLAADKLFLGFIENITDKPLTDDDENEYLENGYFTFGEYSVQLVHSTN